MSIALGLVPQSPTGHLSCSPQIALPLTVILAGVEPCSAVHLFLPRSFGLCDGRATEWRNVASLLQCWQLLRPQSLPRLKWNSMGDCGIPCQLKLQAAGCAISNHLDLIKWWRTAGYWLCHVAGILVFLPYFGCMETWMFFHFAKFFAGPGQQSSLCSFHILRQLVLL